VITEGVPTKRIRAVAISVGPRFPAHATSMGRALLAELPEDAFERYLAEATFERLTAHTVTDPGELRAMGPRRRPPGIRDRGPGT
jgi:IclR family pca regulon transcriptional regulator